MVIVNHNGRALLEVSLPAVTHAARSVEGGCEVVLVDGGSTDDSVAFIRARYPQIRVIGLRANESFARANNVGIRSCSGRIVVLLNNDVVPEPGFVAPLCRHFRNPVAFAVACKLVRWDRRTIQAEYLRFTFDENGLIEQIQPFTNRPDKGWVREPCPTWYAPACAAAFHRDKLLELGGLDELYEPFYWDEIDVSYRAWKRGWTVLYEPDSRVFHMQRQTAARLFSREDLMRIWEKNRFLFMWINLHDASLFRRHLGRLERILSHPRSRSAFKEAMQKLEEAWVRRERERASAVRPDEEIFRLVGSPDGTRGGPH